MRTDLDHVKFRRLETTMDAKRSELTYLSEEWRYSRDVAARALADVRSSLAPEYRGMPAAELLALLEADFPAEEAAAQRAAEAKNPGMVGHAPARTKVQIVALRDIVQADAVVADLAARRGALAAELQPLSTLVSHLRAYVDGAGNSPSFSVSPND